MELAKGCKIFTREKGPCTHTAHNIQVMPDAAWTQGKAWSCYHQCPKNEFIALAERHLLDTPMPDKGALAMLRRLLLKKLRVHQTTLSKWTEQQVLDTKKGALLRRYTTAYLANRREEVTWRQSKVNMFIKIDKDPEEKVRSGTPRCIQHRHPRYTAELALYLAPVEKYVFKQLRSQRDVKTAVFAKGLNSIERAQRILAMAKWGDNSTYVCLDHSRWDAHQRVELLEVEQAVYLGLHPNEPRLKTLLNWQLLNKGRSRNGLSYISVGKRMSGDLNTGLGNSIVNYGVMLWALRNVPTDCYEIFLDGDDCVLCLRSDWVKELLSQDFKQVGQTTKVEKITSDPHAVQFCQCSLVITAAGPRMIRTPIRAMTRTMVTVHKYLGTGWLRYILSLGKCELSLNRGVPVLEAFANCLIRHAGKVKDLPIDSLPYEVRMRLLYDTDPGPCLVTDQARETFTRAFDIGKDDQLMLEKHFDQLDFSDHVHWLVGLRDFQLRSQLTIPQDSYGANTYMSGDASTTCSTKEYGQTDSRKKSPQVHEEGGAKASAQKGPRFWADPELAHCSRKHQRDKQKRNAAHEALRVPRHDQRAGGGTVGQPTVGHQASPKVVRGNEVGPDELPVRQGDGEIIRPGGYLSSTDHCVGLVHGLHRPVSGDGVPQLHREPANPGNEQHTRLTKCHTIGVNGRSDDGQPGNKAQRMAVYRFNHTGSVQNTLRLSSPSRLRNNGGLHRPSGSNGENALRRRLLGTVPHIRRNEQHTHRELGRAISRRASRRGEEPLQQQSRVHVRPGKLIPSGHSGGGVCLPDHRRVDVPTIMVLDSFRSEQRNLLQGKQGILQPGPNDVTLFLRRREDLRERIKFDRPGDNDHSGRGYVGRRSSRALVHHPDTGFTSRTISALKELGFCKGFDSDGAVAVRRPGPTADSADYFASNVIAGGGTIDLITTIDKIKLVDEITTIKTVTTVEAIATDVGITGDVGVSNYLGIPLEVVGI